MGRGSGRASARARSGLLLGGIAPDSEAVLTAFINLANDVTDHMVFVLDDYHLIEDPSIHQALTFLLDHLPPALHLVLAGRGRAAAAAGPLPGAPTSYWSSAPRTSASRWTRPASFLNRQVGLDLADDELAPLHAQLEGWIAGLQLVVPLPPPSSQAAGMPTISGRHRFIADYLSQDVLGAAAR